MSSGLEYYKKFLVGEPSNEKEFDSILLPSKLRELVEKYDISYNREDVVPQDIDMAKRVFDAAVELLGSVGLYCRDTHSLLKISQPDILKALKEGAKKKSLGEGENSVEYYVRKAGDRRPINVIGGAIGAPMSEKNFIPIMTSYAKENVVGLHTGSITSVLGEEIRAKSPTEVLVCKYEAKWAREAANSGGKPGVSIVGIMSGSTSESQDAGDFEGGLRPTDQHLVVFLNELKTDFDVFNKIVHNNFHGNRISAAMGGPTLGGYSGGPESSAITAVAEIMAAFVIAKPIGYFMYPVNLYSGVSSDKWTVWMSSMAALAFQSVDAGVVIGAYTGAASGPCTDMICYEIATQAVAHAASGMSINLGPCGGSLSTLDHFSGMETRILSEINQAAAGLSLAEANDIAIKLNGEYQDEVMKKTCTKGKSFEECYDVEKLVPTLEYVELWERNKEKLARMGLKF